MRALPHQIILQELYRPPPRHGRVPLPVFGAVVLEEPVLRVGIGEELIGDVAPLDNICKRNKMSIHSTVE